jgi:hypothetical protein
MCYRMETNIDFLEDILLTRRIVNLIDHELFVHWMKENALKKRARTFQFEMKFLEHCPIEYISSVYGYEVKIYMKYCYYSSISDSYRH